MCWDISANLAAIWSCHYRRRCFQRRCPYRWLHVAAGTLERMLLLISICRYLQQGTTYWYWVCPPAIAWVSIPLIPGRGSPILSLSRCNFWREWVAVWVRLHSQLVWLSLWRGESCGNSKESRWCFVGSTSGMVAVCCPTDPSVLTNILS